MANVVHQPHYLVGINVFRAIVVTILFAQLQVLQTVELANLALQILSVQLKYLVLIVQ